MIFFVVDDEELQLKTAKRLLNKLEPDATIETFSIPNDVLKTIKKRELIPDVVFCDIEMPEMSGIKLAMKIRKMAPDTRIIFVTSHSEYAVDAFKVRANGYLLKPITMRDLRKELENIPDLHKPDKNKLEVKCFGHFEVFYNERPLAFQRKQTKEMLAFLVDREGALCTSEEIAFALWEDDTDTVATGQRVRNLISDLRSTLGEIGMEDALIRDHRQIAIKKDMLDCDYYRMLDGDATAINSFNGDYMIDYSWAEYTAGSLTSFVDDEE